MGEMRYGWIADAVNGSSSHGLHYELYRPLREYDGLVFVKSMSPDCLSLATTYRSRNKPAVFEMNVNYFEVDGMFYYEGMKQTPEQHSAAVLMAKECNGLIAASRSIEEACRSINPRTTCVTDSVNMALVPPRVSAWQAGSRLRLFWSGQAVKMFDLLVVEEVLRRFTGRIELVLVTTDLSSLELVYEPYRSRLKKLLAEIDCRIISYESIPQLLRVYAEGGVIVSPRFLDSSYNLGHTEWKITLGMACGCAAVCSPQQSYVDVSRLSGGRGIRICGNSSDWVQVFDQMLGGSFDWKDEQSAAAKVVADHYSTTVVAEKHARFVSGLVNS